MVGQGRAYGSQMPIFSAQAQGTFVGAKSFWLFWQLNRALRSRSQRGPK